MKIAWFTPFHPSSRIGHYSEVATGQLADRDEVVVYASEQGEGLAPRSCDLPVRRLPAVPDDALLAELDTFDLLVYNMGDDGPSHRAIYEVAARRPGVVILHDLFLRSFFFHYYESERELSGLADTLVYAHGTAAEGLAQLIRAGTHIERLDDPSRHDLLLFRPALRRALGVIVHSKYAARKIEAACPAPQAVLDFPLPSAARLVRRAISDGKGRVKVLTCGVLDPATRVHAILQAIAGSPLLRNRVEFVAIDDGPAEYRSGLRRQIADTGLEECVRLEGCSTDDALAEHLRQADVVVNLRDPHIGFTSWSLVEALAAGAAAVVWGHGFFDEFPDDVVCKVRAEEELRPALEGLVGEPRARGAMSRRAQDHVRERCRPEIYRDRFREFAEAVRSTAPVLRLVDRVSDVLLELGCGPRDGLRVKLRNQICSLAREGEPSASR